MSRWEATYKGHKIRIEAGIFTKRLFIDGKLRAVSGLGTSIQLTARIEEGEGAGEPVIAKLQGLWPSRCDLVTADDITLSQKPESDPQPVERPRTTHSNLIRGEGTTSSDAWKEVFEVFRRTFPNLVSYDDKELGQILKKKGVKFTQAFGERPRVEAHLENQTSLRKQSWRFFPGFRRKIRNPVLLRQIGTQ